MSKQQRGIVARLLRDSTDNILVQLFRYAFVGGAAFVIDFGTLWLLTEYVGMHYQLSACIAFILGLTANYLLSVKWVFNTPDDANRPMIVKSTVFAIYALIGLVGLGLNSVILWLFTDILMLHYLLSKLVSTAIVFFWNFLARRVLMRRTAVIEQQKAAKQL